MGADMRFLVLLWTIFFARGLFYASFVPLWEGFDEYAHYAVLQNIATSGRALIDMDEPVSREVQASLELAPVPWLVNGLTHDAYWLLPAEERRQREQKLRSLPAALTREPARGGEHAYEAQQAPLYYWLLSPAYRLSAALSLPSRVWLLRLISLLVASTVIPLTYLVARTIFEDDRQALRVAAVVAAFPELMMTVCHIGNDSLAVAMGGLSLLALFEWKRAPESMRRSILLALALGLALLTKAYFLALLPPVTVLLAVQAKRKRVYRQALVVLCGALAIAGWWYARNWILTHSLSGNQFEVAARAGAGMDLSSSLLRVNWLSAADFTFMSHVWLGNWSFLVVRSWMYRFFALVAGVAAIGLIVDMLRPKQKPSRSDLGLLSAIYVTFLAALGYHAARAFQIEGFAGALGYYLFAIVTAEVILAVTGLQAVLPAGLSWLISPAAILCLVALEFFGMTFYSIPYYTGFIAHLPGGAIPALRLSQLRDSGLQSLLGRLASNKPEFLNATVFGAMWILFLAATVALIASAVLLRGSEGSKDSRRAAPAISKPAEAGPDH